MENTLAKKPFKTNKFEGLFLFYDYIILQKIPFFEDKLETMSPIEKYLYRFIAFACLGVTTEIFFTAFYKFSEKGHSTADLLKLEGNSYVWMVFIYGSAAFLIPFYYGLIQGFPLIVRLLLYALGIFLIEYIAGFALDKATGQCPWEYSSRWNISGYIRLDYTPFWMVFGFMLERVSLFLDVVLD